MFFLFFQWELQVRLCASLRPRVAFPAPGHPGSRGTVPRQVADAVCAPSGRFAGGDGVGMGGGEQEPHSCGCCGASTNCGDRGHIQCRAVNVDQVSEWGKKRPVYGTNRLPIGSQRLRRPYRVLMMLHGLTAGYEPHWGQDVPPVITCVLTG